jgi:hypothetical protein
MLPARPSAQIADVLADSLVPAFEALCTDRYGGPLPLHRTVPPGSSPTTLHVRLSPPDHRPLEAAFVIRHLGGNMYDVQGRVEGQPVRSFSYCLPEPAPLLAPAAPQLARDMAVFLLDALERRLGRDLLRRTARRDAAARRPSPTP